IQLYRGPLFLRGFDDDIRAFLAAEMKKKGIDVRFEATVEELAKHGDGVRATLDRIGSRIPLQVHELPTGTPVLDWRGKPYDAKAGPAAHPNSRFTVAARQNASYTSLADAPEGVPISALVFGGRRREVAPLVYQAKSWAHGVLIGAGVASETTAAASGEVGVVRRDPMAMKPFCGYNFADYWAHWLSFEQRSDRLPEIFHVNWFRQDKDGDYLWPGFGENLRVLRWIIDRCEKRVDAVTTPIGLLPAAGDIDIEGLDIGPAVMQALLRVDHAQWSTEMAALSEDLARYGDRLPAELSRQLRMVIEDLDKQDAA
ncbi:MAG: phosphoenolpyruvate carboxykinase (GTP), partial [Proteobacteria bacterium]|nr:phosphoenolpyruvate carboxykinase (GTP) [Pseudomonadota bacterium]